MEEIIISEAQKINVSGAFLVGLRRDGEGFDYSKGLLDELKELSENIGFEILGSELVNLKEPNPHYLVGSGKFKEIDAKATELGAQYIIFDDEITPAQQKNWEKDSGKCVIDRQEVILEIFARRAKTKEARLQIELAKLEYSLPRLKRAWLHLSRQRGGGVTQRGAGESQLETDRRMVSDKISKLKKDLEDVKRVRSLSRKKRENSELPSLAIVGYTNAGKSSLMNKLSDAKVLVENKLFATLDPTTRRISLPSSAELLLTDTVGFVRRLPHSFIEAFKSTLEEAVHSDVLLHLVDASSPDALEHIKTTKAVLKELGASEKQSIVVFNKIDKITDDFALYALRAQYPEGVAISLKTGEGLDLLLQKIDGAISAKSKILELMLPHSQYKLLNKLSSIGAIRRQSFEDDGVFIAACVPQSLVSTVEKAAILKS